MFPLLLTCKTEAQFWLLRLLTKRNERNQPEIYLRFDKMTYKWGEHIWKEGAKNEVANK